MKINVYILFLFYNVNGSYVWLEQISRQETLQSACSKLNPSPIDYRDLDHTLVNDKYKLLYCYVPKVACTNWKRVLLALDTNAIDLTAISASLVHANGTITKLPELDEFVARTILTNYTSFVMVRHPFERLLSAYRNKLEDDKASARYFQSRIGRRIIKKYRKDAREEDIERGNNVTFEEFVRYLIDEGATAMNEHWRPVYELCQPCSLNYTFIGKYESLDDDAQVLLDLIAAPQNMTFPRTRSSGTSHRLRHYYQQLSLNLTERLYRLYENDFKLFGYDLENVLGFDIG